MSQTPERRHIILGTAGHIDHGKTRLVAALTGMDTHRLPEEKRRGISIDLGFANWQTDEFTFGVVDVPGHRRFVRNMVAGATGIDIAMLVVAADDSVMPQTREHLQIMQWLGISCGILVMTKIDLVDEEMRELVQAEVRELVRDTFLQDAPLLQVSSVTQAGIPELRLAIVQAARSHQRQRALWPIFRMPIDRAFSLTGHGTIVTGSALCGEVLAGDRIELLPDQLEVRVRSVQTHHRHADSAEAGQRIAVNLPSVRPEDVPRGKELATSGWLLPTRRLLVNLQGVPELLATRKRMQVALHLGTTEVSARVVLKSVPTNERTSCFAEIVLQQPVVATHGQRFILRRATPAVTLTGGSVLDPLCPPRMRLREVEQTGAALSSSNPSDRVSCLLSRFDLVPQDLRHLAIRCGCAIDDVEAALSQLQTSGQLVLLNTPNRQLRMHRERLTALTATIRRRIEQEIAAHPPGRSRPQTLLLGACRDLANPEYLPALIDQMVADRQLIRMGANLALSGGAHQLTKKQSLAFHELLKHIRDGGLSPPTLKELGEQLDQPVAAIRQLLDIATEDALILRVDPSLHYWPQALEQARLCCVQYFASQPSATMAQLRDAWQVTRKHAVPLAEFFDSQELTRREGDLRYAGRQLPVPFVPSETESLHDGGLPTISQSGEGSTASQSGEGSTATQSGDAPSAAT